MKYFIILALLTLVGCKKEKCCECQHKLNGRVKGVSEQYTDKECSDLNNSTTEGDTTYSLECVEK